MRPFSFTLFHSADIKEWKPSQLGIMGSPRARRHPRLRLFGRQNLRPHFQRCGSRPTPLNSDLIKCIDDGQWGADVFEAHAIGCNAVSWAPAARAGSLLAVPSAGAPRSAPVKRFASAGCDNIVKIWGFSEETQAWVEEDVLEGHADWVRDVAWAPNIGLPRSYIATASQVCSFSVPSGACVEWPVR